MKKHAKKIITALLVITLLVPTVAMLVTNAAATTTVELAFNNIFVFEKWANNSLSSTVISDGTPNTGGTLTTDIQNGSFTLTKTDMAAVELYTAFSMNKEDAAANEDYYMMEVEPNTKYTFTYHVTGNTYSFTPWVFFYNSAGLYNDSLVNYPTPQYNTNSFTFTTPADASYIQLRFTIGDSTTGPAGEPVGNTSATSVNATVKDIAIYKTEIFDNYLAPKNLFSLADWAANEATATSPSGDLGTITTDVDNGKITMVNSGTGYLWTGFGIDTANSNDQYYTMDVAASTSYTLTYDLVDQNLLGPIYLQPFIVEMDSAGKCLTYYPNQTASLSNKFAFTTQATTARIQLVFALITDGDNTASADSPRYCTIDNIGIYKSTDFTVSFETITGHAHRKTYTASTGTYGELPTPTSVPEGMVFAGWYTEPNGSGERITADTAVSYGSYTVYSKYEPAVDSLSVKTLPAKLIYTVGEKFNPAGLVLTYGINTQEDTDGNGTMETVTKYTDISTGYYCTPEYLNTVGTQTITVSYGGKTATFDVTVTDGDDKNIIVNNATYPVKVANNLYTIDYTGSAFNRYEITYFSDAYARGIITFDNDTTEEFFIEPSDNGHFASYIDNFLNSASHTGVKKISFVGLNKDFANIELLSLTTVNATVPTSKVQYYENEKYKVGIDLAFGGVISYIECKEGSTDGNDTVTAARYTDANGNVYTKVDYKDKLPSGAIDTVESVNLINTWDRGRYLQQSYYGTDQAPFVMGDYNGVPWNYNPVQGGNLKSTITGNGGESSKVIDFRITGSQIYVKTRPLDWGKNSTDYADDPAWNTPSYMEAWYTFTTDGKGLIQGSCRFIDYSGYPSNTTTQEFPALYTVEPLNHFVYNEVTKDQAWAATQAEFKADAYSSDTTTTGAQNIEEPDFWGVLPSYNQYNPNGEVDPNIEANEHWAAFTASEDKDSFGIGIYSPGVSNIHYGCFVAKYEENQYKAAGEQEAKEDGGYIAALKAGTQGSYTHVTNYRHASTLDPAVEMNTSYIAPISTLTFESYKPITYTYYVSTGTADEIREDFRLAKETEENAEKEVTKIAVPETVYMTPVADSATYTTIGQHYVNNTLSDLNVVQTVAASADDMYFGLYALDAKEFTVKVTNATNSSNDIDFYTLSSSTSAEGEIITCADSRYRDDKTYGLRFTGTGLKRGEMATAKWEITVTLNDGTKKTYTAYTVLYAPEYTVGAVAEGRHNGDSQNEVSSWITGANGVDHSQRAPLGSYKGDYHDSGYFKEDPLVNTNPPTNATEQSEDDLIITDDTDTDTDDYGDNAYVLQTATNGEDDSRSQSYLGLLKIDKSRYSNTNQIPNLKIGYDALRVGSGAPKDSLSVYNTYYTLGTETAFTSTDLSATPSGWTTHESHSELAASQSIPYRTTVVPSYTVSDDLNGKYIHAIAYGKAYNLFGSNYATAGTSVLISITDKSELRDAVLDGYGVTDGTPLFNEKLQNAATVLGDPTATQEEIDNAKKELSDASKFALKYDNLFSALEFSQHSSNMKMSAANSSVSYSNGTLITTNDTITNGESYTMYGSSADYYQIDLQPNTEYVFEYDVTTTVNSQAFLFFYNSSGGNSEKATNITVQTDRTGAWATKNESNSWIGNYQNGAGSKHYTIKFTTGATTTKVGFRFGNTSNSPTESTFSNIRLIDSARYYADVTYSKTEEAYPKESAYNTIITPTRPGYTFAKWVDAAGNTVSASDVATNHLSVFSVWTENTYTIVYNANGGKGTVANQTATYTETVNLVSGGFTKSGYILAGWATTSGATTPEYALGQSVSKLSGDANGTVTLYAVWVKGYVNITFDNLFDLKAFNISTGNLTVDAVRDTGFTVTSTTGEDANTGFGITLSVEPGKTYVLSADTLFTPGTSGNSFDVYVQALNSSGESDTSFTKDSDVGVESGCYMVKHGTSATSNVSMRFTAGATTTQVRIRFDANHAGNTLAVDNIRFCEDLGISVSPVNKVVQIDGTFGDLPTPTRNGYDFVGWYHNGTKVDSSTVASSSSTYYLTSKWVVNNDALVSDTVVIDFAKPIDITPFANDTVYASAEGTKTFLGITADGTSTPAASVTGTYGTFAVSGNTVTYTPTKAVSGVETVYYHASVVADGVTTNIKNEIIVAPASNVLYEENRFTVANASGVEWKATATAGTGKQEAYPDSDGVEVYGYDSSYNKIENYSNGSALSATVNSTNKRSQNIAFTFDGSGFDLNGACGYNTGVMVVSLKDNTLNDGKGKVVKSYIVDTYYGDYDEEGASKYAGTLYQVPIISETGLTPSNYTIQIVASYLPSMSGALNTNSVSTQTLGNGMTANIAEYANSEELREALADIGMEYVLDAEEVSVVWFDDDSVLNGGDGVNTVEDGMLKTQAVTELVNVVDSVRVYNPITDGDSYYISSEQGVAYYNVIDNLTTKDSLLSGTGLFAYVMGTDKQDITVENYSSIGPKHELYLTSGTGAVTFTINGLDKSKSKVMISLRAASGKPTVSIGSGYTDTIESNTEMYYDITNYVGSDGTVVIKNTTAGTLLSVGTVKLSGVVQPAMLSLFNLDTAIAMMNAPATPVELNTPQAEPDVEEPEDTTTPSEPEDTTTPSEPEDTTVPSEPESTTKPSEPEDTTKPSEPEDTTVPSEPESTTKPSEPEDTTKPSEPEDTTDSTESEDTTDSTESEDTTEPDDSEECWLVRLFKHIIAFFKKIISAISNILGF